MAQAIVLKKIIEELALCAQQIQEEELQEFAELILSANRIFIAGAGRSGFVARAFANRLMHLGRTVFVVGEPTTPAIKEGDLLIIGSGSGETGSLITMANKVKKLGAMLATITIFPQATIGSLSNRIIKIPGVTPKSKLKNTFVSFQPMGNSFEQLTWLVYDNLIMILMDKLHKTSEEMFVLHANLE